MAKYLKKFENHTAYEAASLILPNVSICVTEGDVHYSPYVEPPETRVVVKYNVTDTSSPTKIGYNQYISGFSAIEIDGVEQPSVVSAYTFSTTGEHIVKYTLSDPTKIPYGSFSHCSDMTSIFIPSSVTNLVDDFYGCNSITSITIDSENTVYDSRNNCNAVIKTSTNKLERGCNSTIIPSSVTSIDVNAFIYCTGLTRADVPNGVTIIDSGVFRGCTSLTSVTIPDSVTTIGTNAFMDCTSLTSVTIPSGVTFLQNGAFQNCSSLTRITSNAMSAPGIKWDTFKDVGSNGTLYVPIGSTGYDSGVYNWMATGNYFLGKYGWTKVEQ